MPVHRDRWKKHIQAGQISRRTIRKKPEPGHFREVLLKFHRAQSRKATAADVRTKRSMSNSKVGMAKPLPLPNMRHGGGRGPGAGKRSALAEILANKDGVAIV
jgi:hypothetical protein